MILEIVKKSVDIHRVEWDCLRIHSIFVKYPWICVICKVDDKLFEKVMILMSELG
jgi:hypothetical protein